MMDLISCHFNPRMSESFITRGKGFINVSTRKQTTFRKIRIKKKLESFFKNAASNGFWVLKFSDRPGSGSVIGFRVQTRNPLDAEKNAL